MIRKLLISGHRTNFSVLAFNSYKGTLCHENSFPAPFNASWTEAVFSAPNMDVMIGISERDDTGLLYTFQIDHQSKTCHITSQQPTLGAPAHFITLRDKSAIVLATYLGGSVALYPVFTTSSNALILQDSERTEVLPKFPYHDLVHGPNRDRQRQCHIHQIIEDGNGFLYAPDLGSDRVWIYGRDNLRLKQRGWLQCPLGTGPRHAVIDYEVNIMYVIGELSHTVVAFRLPANPEEQVFPIEGFSPNIIPSSVRSAHHDKMDSAEICLNSRYCNTLYVSNRWVRHIAKRGPYPKDIPEEIPDGDSVAIILLSQDGAQVECIRHLQTKIDVIRGMRVTEDGQFVVVVGEVGGGVAIYSISGTRGEVWTLVANLYEDLEAGIKHAIWL